MQDGPLQLFNAAVAPNKHASGQIVSVRCSLPVYASPGIFSSWLPLARRRHAGPASTRLRSLLCLPSNIREGSKATALVPRMRSDDGPLDLCGSDGIENLIMGRRRVARPSRDVSKSRLICRQPDLADRDHQRIESASHLLPRGAAGLTGQRCRPREVDLDLAQVVSPGQRDLGRTHSPATRPSKVCRRSAEAAPARQAGALQSHCRSVGAIRGLPMP